jgi:hypothetical protein
LVWFDGGGWRLLVVGGVKGKREGRKGGVAGMSRGGGGRCAVVEGCGLGLRILKKRAREGRERRERRRNHSKLFDSRNVP